MFRSFDINQSLIESLKEEEGYRCLLFLQECFDFFDVLLLLGEDKEEEEEDEEELYLLLFQCLDLGRSFLLEHLREVDLLDVQVFVQ